MSRQNILCRDRVLPRLGDFMSQLSILCRDRVGQGKEKLCHDKKVYVMTELAKEGKFLSRRNVIMSRLSILTSRHKISRHKVSLSQHSALCHDSGVRRCVANKAGCDSPKPGCPLITR